ncbi:DUF1517-domain-containing protein, partial [Haematococcus lacustris]
FGLLQVLLCTVAVAAVFNSVRSMSKTRSADRFAGYADTDAGVAGPVTVARLQVGLLGLARGLKSDLDQLATRADTSSTPGLHLVLQAAAFVSTVS